MRPEDVLKVDADEDGVEGDDCAHCLRYLVATKSRTIVKRKLRGLLGSPTCELWFVGRQKLIV